MSLTSDLQPRERVDAALSVAGYVLQDGNEANPDAAYAVAVRKWPLAFSPKHGNADYLLYVSGVLGGVVRIVAELPTIPDVDEEQAATSTEDEEPVEKTRALKTGQPLHWGGSVKRPAELQEAVRAPFMYETDGIALHVKDTRIRTTRPHLLYHFHRPAALAAKLTGTPVPLTGNPEVTILDSADLAGSTLLDRLEDVPTSTDRSLWSGERLVLGALQTALRRGNRRVLAQMAPGSGKTHTLLNLAYQLLENGRADRVLLIVDNDPLAYQTAEEFRALRPPVNVSTSATPLPLDVLPEHHTLKVQQLAGHGIDADAQLIVATPFRLLALWHDHKPAYEDTVSHTLFCTERVALLPTIGQSANVRGQVLPYNMALPIDAFDAVLADDLSPSALAAITPLFNYFDAPLAALCGTPSHTTLQLFGGRLLAEYPYEQAIADGAILPFQTYAVRAFSGSDDTLEAQAGPLEIHREPDYVTRIERWRQTEDSFILAEDVESMSGESAQSKSDRDFTVLLTLRDRLPREIFAGRSHVPKTLIVARDQKHAEALLGLVHEVFSPEPRFAALLSETSAVDIQDADMVFHASRGNSGVRGEPRTPSPDSRYPKLTAFRSDVFPRIGLVSADSFAVTLDLRPTEVLVMLAPMSSRAHFEAIKARAIRTMRRTEYLRVTTDGHRAAGKTHAVIVDAVGLFDSELPSETFPLDRRPTVPMAQLLHDLAFGAITAHTLRALAARFLQLDCLLSPDERDSVAKAAGGATLHTMAMRMIAALDSDRQIAQASRALRGAASPTPKMVEQAAASLFQHAVSRLHTSVELRSKIIQLERQHNPKSAAENDAPSLPDEDLSNEETWR